ncbi:hypothetical protein Tco_1207350 [Tanacetum coccineum]
MPYSSSSSDSEVSTDSICLKTCKQIVETFKTQNEQVEKDLRNSELMVLGYKEGLKSVEARLEYFKSNESIYVQDIKKLKWDVEIRDLAITDLTEKLELAQKEKDSIQLNVDKLENASKSLNKLIECQIVDNCKKGLGYESYSAVPPPYTGNFMPPKPDLSFVELDESVTEPAVENIKEWVSNDEDEEYVIQPKFEKKTVKPSVKKIEFVKPKQ